MSLLDGLQSGTSGLQDAVADGLNVSGVLGDPVSAMRSALKTWKGNLAMMPDIVREVSYLTPLSVSPLLALLLLSLARDKNCPDTKTSFKPEYDFIIVGAGSAGSVIASRLSELPCVDVLLVEAGKTPPLLTEVPLLAGIFKLSDIDWKFKTVPQKCAAHALVDRKVPFGKGKVIGGSGIMNNMFYNRGHRKNYDEWAENGAQGWGWNDVFPSFLKAENNTNPDLVKRGNHAVGGPMTVSQMEIDPDFTDVIPEIAAHLGYPFHDASEAGQIGLIDVQANVRDNQRCSTAKGYLVPAEKRPNLDIVKEAYVTKILINGNRTDGVVFDYNGTRHEVKARKEVILCAGAINTPKLLMLSGIGPKETLEKYGIPLNADISGVGKNFHDHAATIMNFHVNSSVSRTLIESLNPLNTWQYIKTRTGPLAESTGFVSISFFANDESKDQDKVPDSEEYFVKGFQEFLKKYLNLDSKVYDRLYAPYLLTTMLFCIAEATHPRSRGYVTLQSSDPYDPPLIDPKYYSDRQDLEDIVSGMKMCLKMMSAPAMKKFNPRLSEALMPGCEKFAKRKDKTKYLRCYARHYVVSECHDVGTAKMGDPSHRTTVVDPELRVKGIDKLRVADASVIPSVPTGNTNNPVIMIGEKAADIIKKGYRCQ